MISFIIGEIAMFLPSMKNFVIVLLKIEPKEKFEIIFRYTFA